MSILTFETDKYPGFWNFCHCTELCTTDPFQHFTVYKWRTQCFLILLSLYLEVPLFTFANIRPNMQDSDNGKVRSDMSTYACVEYIIWLNRATQKH